MIDWIIDWFYCRSRRTDAAGSGFRHHVDSAEQQFLEPVHLLVSEQEVQTDQPKHRQNQSKRHCRLRPLLFFLLLHLHTRRSVRDRFIDFFFQIFCRKKYDSGTVASSCNIGHQEGCCANRDMCFATNLQKDDDIVEMDRQSLGSQDLGGFPPTPPPPPPYHRGELQQHCHPRRYWSRHHDIHHRRP